MLRSRIIPTLLIHNKGLVKTVNFEDKKYVGDPINAVKIFNEKEVDELIVLDIDASVNNREPDYKLIKNLAKECRMPFCYGGGIKTVQQAVKIVELGVEKVALSSIALDSSNVLKEIGNVIGFQSVVVVLDYKKKKSFLGKESNEMYIHNGKKKTGIFLEDFVEELNNIGVGEIVINSILHDGKMEGYDYLTAKKIREICDVPLTILGGAGKLEDIKSLVSKIGIVGAAAGSLFVFKGKYRAVLINYPFFSERKDLYDIVKVKD